MRKNLSNNWKSILFYIVLPIILIACTLVLSGRTSKNQKTTYYSEIVSMFQNNEIKEYSLNLSSGALTYKTFAKPDETKSYTVPSVTYFIDDVSGYVNQYNTKNKDKQIKYNYVKGSSSSWFVSLLPSIMIFAMLGFFSFWLIRRMSSTIGNETNRTLGFGKIKPRTNENEGDNKKTFSDVAGCDEEKAELTELVDYLKNPERYTELGARIPKGVLLVGPPGTGKTLLAKAVAGEADAPFLSISGSDFVEMYVGVGASRVRDLFEQAKKKSPAIVFIDEIDAVGRQRGAGTGGGNDEREQTLNQLLVEMDGFGTNSGVIVIAATNRPDVLDPAILRPGRFDRQITVNRPDLKGREDILKVHAKNKPLAPDVDLKEISKTTIGFTGADLENLLNEAALLAVRNKKHAISMTEIIDASTRVLMGTEKKTHKYSDKAKKLTAYHEAGHAVASYYLDNHDPVLEISIIARGLGAGGYTMYQPQEENYDSKLEMLDNLVSMMGGRVAEALKLGDISTGASNDLKRATQIARDMVSKYGMTDEIGPVVYNDENDQIFLGRDFGHVNNYSQEMSAKIDSVVEKILRDAYDRAAKILTENDDRLVLVAEQLISTEKISGDDFAYMMENGVLPNKEIEVNPIIDENNSIELENTDDEPLEKVELREDINLDDTNE